MFAMKLCVRIKTKVRTENKQRIFFGGLCKCKNEKRWNGRVASEDVKEETHITYIGVAKKGNILTVLCVCVPVHYNVCEIFGYIESIKHVVCVCVCWFVSEEMKIMLNVISSKIIRCELMYTGRD